MRFAAARALLVAVLASGLGPVPAALAQSCAMCGSSFGPGDPTARAISYSILFLMAAPYSLFAVVAGWLYFMYRRAGGRHRASVLHLPWVRRNPPPTA
jgi:hypothetical protein